MTKRTAEEALVDVSSTANGCDENKEHRPSSSAGGEISSSSSCSIAPASCSNTTATTAATTKPLCRTVTAVYSTIDDNTTTNATTTTQAGYKDPILGAKNNVAIRQQITRLINGRILQRDGTLLPGSIDISNGIIVGMILDGQHADVSSNIDDDTTVQVVDCQGQIISPGFIDIQLNGAYGVDFSNDCSSSSNGSNENNEQANPCLDVEDILKVAERLVETGVTSFCPTMVSSSRSTYRRILSLMRIAREQQQELHHHHASNYNKGNNMTATAAGGANILGMHLEGPFFALSKRGAHDEQHIVAPVNGMSSVEEVYGIDTQNNDGDGVSILEDIDIVTLAPELDGAFDAIQSLTGLDSSTSTHPVVVSCGHTEATFEDGIQALTSGATLLTHLYNAMNPFHHRKPGLVGLLSSKVKLTRMGLNRPFYSIIADGLHVHESAMSMAYQSHPHGCVLVTDAMTAMGLGDGNHMLGNMKVCIEGDRATLAGTDTLAGSVVSMDTCVKRFHRFSGCSVGEALLCATLHPAMVLNRHVLQQKGGESAGAPIGVLEVGFAADILMVNDDLDVIGTWIAGRCAFKKTDSPAKFKPL